MPPSHSEPLIAGIVVSCIVLGLIFSTLIFCLVQLYQPLHRTREAIMSQIKPIQKLGLGV
jgi:hypothetical protein